MQLSRRRAILDTGNRPCKGPELGDRLEWWNGRGTARKLVGVPWSNRAGGSQREHETMVVFGFHSR